MSIRKKTIRTYITPSGREPFVEWMVKLKDSKVRSIIHTRITRLKLANYGDYRRISNNLYELKIRYGPGYRVYFGELGKEIILLLCAGNKGTQKEDITKAKKYWNEYRNKKDG